MRIVDMRNSSYARIMTDKDNEYRSLINQARMESIKNDGQPTKDEARLYSMAAAVCEEIIAMNINQPSIKMQWISREQSCTEKMEEILKVLAPDLVEKKIEERINESTQDVSESEKTQLSGQNKGTWKKPLYREVTPELIKSWHRDIPKHGIEDVVGMDEMKKSILGCVEDLQLEQLNEYLRRTPATKVKSKCALFYGLPGSGKTFAIDAMANELMTRNNYTYLVLENIRDSLVGVAEKIISTAIQEALDCAPSILFIDEFDGVCVDRSKEGVKTNDINITNAFLTAYNKLEESDKHVILICATNNPGSIDQAMMSRFKGNIISVPLPPKETREEFFRENIEESILEDGFTVEDMADATEGYSFRDCTGIVERVITNIVDDLKIYKEDGSLDVEATDAGGIEKLMSGKYLFTKVRFMNIVKETPPSASKQYIENLKNFEESRRVNLN